MMGFSDYSFVNIRFSTFAIRPSGTGMIPKIGQRVPNVQDISHGCCGLEKKSLCTTKDC